MAKQPTELTLTVDAEVRRLLDGSPSPERLLSALRYLAKWRTTVVGNTLRGALDGTIAGGPFAGMRYPVAPAEGSYPARLLGAYEASLWPVIAQIVRARPDLIIDIGCAEGYYAVGLARALADSMIWARDESEAAQGLCRALATANGVTNLRIGGLVTHAELAIAATERTVIICDIEGAEEALLDPVRCPALRHADILVEVHEGLHPGLSGRLTHRFAPTHQVMRIGRSLAPDLLPPVADGWSDLDRLIALWEWRTAPTPWLWMQVR
jgi:hypothetical protein